MHKEYNFTLLLNSFDHCAVHCRVRQFVGQNSKISNNYTLLDYLAFKGESPNNFDCPFEEFQFPMHNKFTSQLANEFYGKLNNDLIWMDPFYRLVLIPINETSCCFEWMVSEHTFNAADLLQLHPKVFSWNIEWILSKFKKIVQNNHIFII